MTLAYAEFMKPMASIFNKLLKTYNLDPNYVLIKLLILGPIF